MVAAMHSEANRGAWTERMPLGGYSQPEEIGESIAFLLDGTKSSSVTGQTLAVDGGFMAAGGIEKARR